VKYAVVTVALAFGLLMAGCVATVPRYTPATDAGRQCKATCAERYQACIGDECYYSHIACLKVCAEQHP
jgi:hypothetical protein